MSTSNDQPPPDLAVEVPADVDRPDRLLAGLTATQLVVLGMTGLVLWAAHTATRGLLSTSAFAVAAAPVVGVVLLVVTGRRDGVSVGRLAAAAARHVASRRPLTTAPGVPVPGWAGGLPRAPVPGQLRLPAQGVGSGGVLDLGRDGVAAVCAATTVNLRLRSAAEQEALLAGYAGWLNPLSGPTQIVVRADRVELTPLADALQDGAASLADPALEAAALDHARFLVDLAADTDLLRRQVLVVAREPVSSAAGRAGRAAAGRRVLQRAAENRASLAALGIHTVVLNGPQAVAVLAAAADPLAPPPPAGLATPDAVITGPDPTDPQEPR